MLSQGARDNSNATARKLKVGMRPEDGRQYLLLQSALRRAQRVRRCSAAQYLYIYWTTYVYLLVQYLHTPATNDPICTRLCNHAGFLTRYFATTEFLKKESEASGEITFYDTVTGKPVENPLSNQ